MPWIMQIKIEDEWRSISQLGKPPYRYETEAEAERMLRICYPDLCRDDRLAGVRERTRVVEVSE
jgi:hypothetical protein